MSKTSSAHKADCKKCGQAVKEQTPKCEFNSEDLFRGEREVVILHAGAPYRLQITKAGKLILNK